MGIAEVAVAMAAAKVAAGNTKTSGATSYSDRTLEDFLAGEISHLDRVTFSGSGDRERLEEIASHFEGEVEIITTFRSIGERDRNKSQPERIVAMLRIRPETLDELCGSLGMNRLEAVKYVDALRQEHIVQEVEFEGQSYYTLGW